MVKSDETEIKRPAGPLEGRPAQYGALIFSAKMVKN